MKLATNLELFQALQAVRTLGCLPMVTIYDHPTDYPEGFIGRLFITGDVNGPTMIAIASADIEDIRERLEECGLTPLDRSESDDAKIVETWL